MSHSPIVPLSPRPQVESGWLPPPRSSSFNRSEYRNIASPSPFPFPLLQFLRGGRNIFVVRFFLGGQSDSIFTDSPLPFDSSPFDVLPLWNAAQRFLLLRSSLFSSSSFIFPLSRFEVWKEKKRGGREGEKKGGGIEEKSRKKRTVSFELERIFLLLQFFFSSQRIESTDVQVVLRTSFSSGEECICFTNIHFCFAK